MLLLYMALACHHNVAHTDRLLQMNNVRIVSFSYTEPLSSTQGTQYIIWSFLGTQTIIFLAHSVECTYRNIPYQGWIREF